MMDQYRTAPGSGSAPGFVREVTTETLNLRMDHSLDLAPLWILALRADLPLLAKYPVTSGNPDGDYLTGVGDADVQAVIIHNLDQRWTIGFGARLITPTGGDTFGAGKWQIMPAAGVRYALWEINSSSYFEPVVRYDVSFAGDPTRKQSAIRTHLQLGPSQSLVSYLLSEPGHSLQFRQTITGQTGRLFLPFDVRIGRKLSDNVTLSLEVGVPVIKDYPVYDFKTQVRLNVTY
jgi:hypothetical protein